jgi:hypothetical protein
MSTDAIEALSFFFGTAAALWAAAYAWTQWLKHRFDGERPQPLPHSVDTERISRLEGAVEALAVELERIGEGQRYTVKLLEERLPKAVGPGRASQPGESGHVVTPH